MDLDAQKERCDSCGGEWPKGTERSWKCPRCGTRGGALSVTKISGEWEAFFKSMLPPPTWE
jgi:tRNA(Ile2) C34 agmatinyltransferase TiaS